MRSRDNLSRSDKLPACHELRFYRQAGSLPYVAMPANLTPQYKKAEEEYRRAQTPEEELRCLELMLREIPKHKGTDKLQAELKAKISKARQESEHAKKTG